MSVFTGFSHDQQRRRLLMAMALTPFYLSPFKSNAAAIPEQDRIVALEWLPTELLLALGIMPLAVADIPNYNLWVSAPKLADTVIEIGQRTEPNLELLQSINPSLILLVKGYGPAPQKLRVIAPTLAFDFNQAGANPLRVARNSLQQLAQQLGLERRASEHLQQFDDFLSTARQRLQDYARQPLLLFSLLDRHHVLIMGQNSLFQAVLDQLGIENAWQGDTNFWGTSVVGIERLAVVKNVRAIYLDHGNQGMMARVSATPLWQALPFVRQQQLRKMPAVWFYGATLSAMRFCRLLEQAWEQPR
jgi:iron complex transport system substrate-binding protein